MLEETDASGAAQADYIYLNGRPVAVLNGSTLYYLHDDMLGTPQLATDSSQAVQWQASYDAFGQASVSGNVTQNLRLPGQYFDVESGWNHFCASLCSGVPSSSDAKSLISQIIPGNLQRRASPCNGSVF